jgi:hypothetical protein
LKVPAPESKIGIGSFSPSQFFEFFEKSMKSM